MSCDIRGSSVRSCPVWSRGGCTSVVGGDEGGGTVVVSTLRSDGLVAGFFFGQPYSTVSSNAAITQISRLWIILGPPLALSEPVGSRGPRGEDGGWDQIYIIPASRAAIFFRLALTSRSSAATSRPCRWLRRRSAGGRCRRRWRPSRRAAWRRSGGR